jgi:hypothetical protein
VQKYKFICPYCGEDAQIIERATVVRYTELIGFSGEEPEFSEDENFGDAEDFEYVCSNCSNELEIYYEQLCSFTKKHGEILKDAQN